MRWGLSFRREQGVSWKQYLKQQKSVATIEEIDALPLDTKSVYLKNGDDQKIKAISRLRWLQFLYQDGNSKITDEGLAILGKMASLEAIDLEWSDSITDRGLLFLSDLSSLKWLDIGFCRSLTPTGILALRSALPGCEIDADGSGHGF
jgi:hypothetical protein